MASSEWQILSSHAHQLGEGLRIMGGKVHWVDLFRGELYAWSPESQPQAALVQHHPVPLGVVEQDASGHLIGALGTGIADLTDPNAPQMLATTGLDGARHRVNDGSFAPDGTFWFGTMVHDESAPEGSVWRWDPDSGDLRQVIMGIDIPNGPTFLPDGCVLVADSGAGRILRSTLADPAATELFAEVAGGSPDGMHVDAAGRVWNAVWGGSRLDIYSADGDILGSVPMPMSQVTSVLVTDGVDPLVVVTSAAVGLAAPGPFDGHTLAAPLHHVFPAS